MITIEKSVNPLHYSLTEALGPRFDEVTFESVRDSYFSTTDLVWLRMVGAGLPEIARPTFDDDVMAKYEAFVVAPKSQEGQTGVFFFPGILGTASTNAHTVANLYREISEYQGRPIRMAAAFSSSFGKDMVEEPIMKNVTDRAGAQAHLLADLLKKNPCENAWLIGHSQGAVEGVYMLPILQELIETRGLKTRVEGLILTHPGGLYSQWNPLSLARFAGRQIAESVEAGGIKYLNGNQKPETKERTQELKDILYEKLHGASIRDKKRFESLPWTYNARMFWTSFREDLRVIPSEIRGLISVPTGIIWGEGDVNFPAQQAVAAVIKAGGEQSLFPNSPKVDMYSEENWPHIVPPVDAPRFGRTIVSAMKRLLV